MDYSTMATPEAETDEAGESSAASRPRPDLPLVVSYGAGVDSTAVLVGLKRLGIRPDVVIFANVGSEKPETYDYLPVIDAWLEKVGFPRLTVVRNKCPKAGHASIEQNCLTNQTLPSQAFRGGKPGGGACSSRWKHEPMDRWLLRQGASRPRRTDGHFAKRVRVVGFDAGPQDCKRAARGSDEAKKHGRDVFWYPLHDWKWDRERCKAEILAEGLPLPPKSSCFLCPAMKDFEIRDLATKHPALLRRAIKVEQAARDGKHGLKTIVGLGRSYSWESFAMEEKLLSEYGGPADSPDATDGPAPETKAWLTAREVLV